MLYQRALLHFSDKAETIEKMFTFLLVSASSLELTLGSSKLLLDGTYILCLSEKENIKKKNGKGEISAFHFSPGFYLIDYLKDSSEDGAVKNPDFNLFRERNEKYFGLVKLTSDEYDMIRIHFNVIEKLIENSAEDYMWSHSARREIKDILNIVECANRGEHLPLGNKVLRYIKEHVGEKITVSSLSLAFATNRTTIANEVKALTGLSLMKYVTEERLYMSRPDLLFTNESIKSIALKYGFSDSNYYVRTFKNRFGITPMAFRKQGREEKDESLEYYKNDSDEMTVTEFENYIMKGLGRAVINLKKAKNKEIYKKSFVTFLKETKYFSGLLPGKYEAMILREFDDCFSLAKELAEYFLKELSVGNKTLMIPFLIELGYEKEVREVMEEFYKTSYENLLSLMKEEKNKEKTGENEGLNNDKFPPESCAYMTAAGVMGRLVKPGRERIKQILCDIADFYDYSDHPYIPCFQNPLFQMRDGSTHEEFWELMDEVAKEHPHGQKIHLNNEVVILPRIIPKTTSTLTLEEMTAPEAFSYPAIDILRATFADAPQKLKEEAAELILKTDDKKLRDHLLRFFYEDFPDEERYSPPEFPLDPTPLIELAEYERKNYDDGIRGYYSIFHVLQNMRHPKVKEYGKKLLKERILEKYVDIYARKMVFLKNYDPSDREDFSEYIRSYEIEGEFSKLEMFIYGIEHKTEGMPTELIPFVFSSIKRGFDRRRFVEALIVGGLLSREIREECLYDADHKIREMASDTTIVTLGKYMPHTVYFASPPK